jgi:hypothetical protein
MSRFLLSVHVSDEPREAPTPEQMQHLAERIGALEAEMRSAGAWVFSGRMTGPQEAKVVRARKGRPLITDGPFVEAKEHIGGFYIIESDSPDAALEWASKTSEAIGMPIEVWPFADFAN